VVALALLFRLPLVVQGAAGAVTPDGALSGIVALHARDGISHLVFVSASAVQRQPEVAPDGAARAVVDPAVAFALVSVLFYAAFAAGVVRLAALVEGATPWDRARGRDLRGLRTGVRHALQRQHDGQLRGGAGARDLGRGAGRALGARARGRAGRPGSRSACCSASRAGATSWRSSRSSPSASRCSSSTRGARFRAAPALALGLVAGYFPALVWNAGNGWASFRYLLPGGGVGSIEAGPGLAGRLAGMAAGQWPVLLGFDPGYGALADRLLLALAWLAVGTALGAVAWCARDALRAPMPVLRALVLWVAVNLAIVALALPLVPGNPRYLLFLMDAAADPARAAP
jgi:hypothetical protein